MGRKQDQRMVSLVHRTIILVVTGHRSDSSDHVYEITDGHFTTYFRIPSLGVQVPEVCLPESFLWEKQGRLDT